MESAAIERAADLLAEARLRTARFGSLPAEYRPRTEPEAYAVQDALHRRLTAAGRGETVGHKIGCTTEVMQRYLGIGNPCAGGIFAPTVHHVHAELRHADFLHAGVECEIAVRLGLDLPPRPPRTTGTASRLRSPPVWPRSRSWTIATRTTARWIRQP